MQNSCHHFPVVNKIHQSQGPGLISPSSHIAAWPLAGVVSTHGFSKIFFWKVNSLVVKRGNEWQLEMVVTGTMEFYDFPYIGNFIIPTDELIFKGVGQPPTRQWRIHEDPPKRVIMSHLWWGFSRDVWHWSVCFLFTAHVRQGIGSLWVVISVANHQETVNIHKYSSINHEHLGKIRVVDYWITLLYQTKMLLIHSHLYSLPSLPCQDSGRVQMRQLVSRPSLRSCAEAPGRAVPDRRIRCASTDNPTSKI